MAGGDDTRMGPHASGGDEFLTTQWNRILDAKTTDGQRRRQATGAIVEQYWKPVYCFLRRKGLGDEEAKDVTQGFFCDVFLGRQLVQGATPGEGRFRAFLLTALERYRIGRHRAATARKRNPGDPIVSLEGLASLGASDGWTGPLRGTASEPGQRAAWPPADSMTPADAFAYAWASTLVRRVVKEVAESCIQAGLARHWAIFEATVVRPALEGEAAPPLAELCGQLGIDSQAKASNMSMTVRRRFQAALRADVRHYVESDDQVDDEIRDLMAILAKK